MKSNMVSIFFGFVFLINTVVIPLDAFVGNIVERPKCAKTLRRIKKLAFVFT